MAGRVEWMYWWYGCGGGRKGLQTTPLYFIFSYCYALRMLFGQRWQEKPDQGYNIANLLDFLYLMQAIVTLDAMGYQRIIA